MTLEMTFYVVVSFCVEMTFYGVGVETLLCLVAVGCCVGVPFFACACIGVCVWVLAVYVGGSTQEVAFFVWWRFMCRHVMALHTLGSELGPSCRAVSPVSVVPRVRGWR